MAVRLYMPPWRAKKSSSATVRMADFTPGAVVSDESIPAPLRAPVYAALARDPAITPEPDHSLVRPRSVQICEQWLWLWTLCIALVSSPIGGTPMAKIIL